MAERRRLNYIDTLYYIFIFYCRIIIKCVHNYEFGNSVVMLFTSINNVENHGQPVAELGFLAWKGVKKFKEAPRILRGRQIE